MNSANSVNSADVGPGFEMLYSSAASKSSLHTGCLHDWEPKQNGFKYAYLCLYVFAIYHFDVEENIEHLELPQDSLHFVVYDDYSIH